MVGRLGAKRNIGKINLMDNVSTNNVTPQPLRTKGAKQAQDNDDLRKPTAREYASEAAKEFLNILEAVAEAIPIPGVGAAVKIAANLIRMCDEIHTHSERANELKRSIMTLVTVLVNELKGKKTEDMQEKRFQDIHSLARDLRYFQRKLEEIASQRPLLLILFKSSNKEKIGKCVDRLNNSLQRFTLMRELHHSNILGQLEKQIRSFHASQQQSLDHIETAVDEVQAATNDVKAKMDDIKAILNERQSATSCSSQLRSRCLPPANTDIFYGRDTLVAELVHIVTNDSGFEGQKRPRICILGPGGMGKTSTALAVMAHPDTKKHFPDSLVWVPCVKATSTSLFFDTLYSSLGVTRNTGNARNDVLAELRSSEPLVLLLDNFETPWNVDGARSDAERILRDINQIPHIALFVTMRSSAPPCDGIQWYSVNLDAVDADAARHIYSDIYTDGSADPNLAHLLDMVGNMPLAITLMAKVGKLTGLSAEQLVDQYDKLGTAMLGQGSDAAHSMDICISLSVYSPSMKGHPEAFNLVATLAALPVGTTYGMLANWWARTVSNLMGALEVLRETSLVEKRGATFSVLPVIRRYILDSSRFPDKVHTSMIESACNFLAQHKYTSGDDMSKAHAAAIATEEDNLQTILLDTATPTPALIEALIILAMHQESTRPRTDVIQHALNLTRGMDHNSALMGNALFSYGTICASLDRYQDSRKNYRLAYDLFMSIGDIKQAARCLPEIADAYGYDSNDSHDYARDRALIADARSKFKRVNDRHGVALCLYYHGRLQSQYGFSALGSFSDAVESFHRARVTFAEFDDTFKYAQCSEQLSLLYFWQHQYEEAQLWAASAVQDYNRIGRYDYGTVSALLLVRLSIIEGDYAVALGMLIELLKQSKSYGAPITPALTLEQLGRTWAKLGQNADAREAFEECVRLYSSTEVGRDNVIRCRFFLRKLEDPFANPRPDEVRVICTYYAEDIEDIL